MKYAVLVTHNFDVDSQVYLFDTQEKAIDYMNWLCNKYYQEEVSEGSDLDMENTFCDDIYGKIAWADGVYTEFTVSNVYEIDENYGK